MGANLMLVIIVPVLFYLVSVCALGKRVFFFHITFILCVVNETRVKSY